MDNYQYPSVALSRRYTGDRDLSTLYRGESDKLLYQLKNLMKFRQLGQLKMTRLFTDGTVITAWSIFGQDFVNVDVSRTIPISIAEPVIPEIPGQCTITFINLPSYVQPMRYPGVIMTGEIEGIDYHKTYYTIDASNCPTCKDIAWEFLFRYLQSSPLVPLPEPPLPISTRVEWPIEPLHRHEYNADGLLLDHDGTDHTVYSLEPSAWGEIIKRGTDDGGTHIIWKAYTEALGGVISRTGLGIMRLVARIKDNADLEKCAQNARIEVDCCIKSDEDRPVVINWEKCIISDWCAAPDSAPMSDLAYFQVWSWILMSLKVSGDGCPPYEWSLSGIGEIIPTWGNRKFITYKVPAGEFYARDCRAQLVITGNDRCGTSDSILFRSCCDNDPAPLAIGYTSLQMSCSGKQTVTAGGGCGPYSWSFSGGGTLVPGGPGNFQAIYTAPDTNPLCNSSTGNPTITLTDCCGSSKSIRFAVNCWTGADLAYAVFDPELAGTGLCGWACNKPGSIKGCVYDSYQDNHKCTGVYIDTTKTWLLSPNIWPVKFCTPLSSSCSSPCSVFPGLFRDNNIDACPTEYYISDVCGQTRDKRTSTMKNGGCCPINPFTGLPF